MNTFVLNPQTANSPVQDLLTRVAGGSVEIVDVNGNVLAYVLSPIARESLIYAEARLDLEQHQDNVKQALSRRGGVTTKQLLEKAQAAENQQNFPS